MALAEELFDFVLCSADGTFVGVRGVASEAREGRLPPVKELGDGFSTGTFFEAPLKNSNARFGFARCTGTLVVIEFGAGAGGSAMLPAPSPALVGEKFNGATFLIANGFSLMVADILGVWGRLASGMADSSGVVGRS